MNHKGVWDSVLFVLLAVAGGFARLLRTQDKKAMKLWNVLGDIFVSGFVGFMVVLLAQATALPTAWVGVLSGISGWIGPRVLDAIADLAEKKTGIKLTEDKEEKGNE